MIRSLILNRLEQKAVHAHPALLNVPAKIAEDHTEACVVLPDSPKSSAALGRRCLQNILREAAKVKPGKLADEIQRVIDNKNIHTRLVEASTPLEIPAILRRIR